GDRGGCLRLSFPHARLPLRASLESSARSRLGRPCVHGEADVSRGLADGAASSHRGLAMPRTVAVVARLSRWERDAVEREILGVHRAAEILRIDVASMRELAESWIG